MSLKYSVYLFLLFFMTSMAYQKEDSCKTHNKKLKILVVVGAFPVLSQTFILNQITGLIDRGCNVDIYAKKRGDTITVQPNVVAYDLLNRTTYDKPPKLGKYDVILCEFGTQGATFAHIKKKRGLKSKLVVCFRGYDLSEMLTINSDRYNELFDIGDLFLPVCDFFKKKLIKLGCPPKKIVVSRSAIDCAKFTFKKRSPGLDGKIHIVTTGRLVEKKGIEYAIRAVADLCQRYSNITYTIIGDGPLRDDLQNLIDQLYAGNSIKLIGSCSHDEVISILDSAHMFVLPSVTASSGDQEGIPNVLKEAMAMGLPVVSTCHSGIPELVEDGVSGFLVSERDIEALISSLEYLIENSDVWPDMGYAGRKKIEQEYNMEKENDNLGDLLN